MVDYSKIANGINVTSLHYNENIARQEKVNKLALAKMEKRVRELVKLGVSTDIAKAIGQTYFYRIKKAVAIVEKVRVSNNKKIEQKEVTFKRW